MLPSPMIIRALLDALDRRRTTASAVERAALVHSCSVLW